MFYLQVKEFVLNPQSDKGEEGIVIKVDSISESYWVSIWSNEIRHNNKHLFFLEMPKEKSFKPLESSTPSVDADKSLKHGVKSFGFASLDNTSGFPYDFFSFNSIDTEAEGVGGVNSEGDKLRLRFW